MISLSLPVTESSQVGEVRRRAAHTARSLGFDEGDAGRVALAATEAATNIVKHAGSGEMLLRVLGDAQAPGIELIALDRGPGMANVAESLRDGHSTAGSPGFGLGSLARNTADLQIYSQPGKGTSLRCELWAAGTAPAAARLACGGVSVAKPGEQASGDDWLVLSERGQHTVAVIDGLGHGADAAAATRAASSVLSRSKGSAEQLVDAMHHGLRSTRGAAAAVAVVQPERGTLAYAGIGNINGVIRHARKSRHLVSLNGILGHKVRTIREMAFAFPEHALLIMHSDGLSARWDLDDYPGLEAKHPGLIAAVLYRDHARRRDDVTVAIVRNTMLKS